MATPTQPIFGLIPTGSPIIINPTTAPSPTSFIYTLPRIAFSHIVVFLLPGITLPPNTAAAVYLSTTPQDASTFKFLGGIGPGKESAIFKVNGSGSSDVDTNLGGGSEITIGISVESADSVSAQMLSLQQSQTQSSSTDMVLANKSRTPISTADTVQLAQKIIKNAFNFLASFSGNVAAPSGGNGIAVEVVPLKAFEEWWRKFEGKVRNDPGFLQRGDGD